MSDVNAFVEALGQDINAAVVPQIERLAQDINTTAFNRYGPRVSAFAGELVKDIIQDQATTVRDFVTRMIQDLAHRYRPELNGDLQTRIVQGAIEVTGRGVRLDVKHRDTGAPVTSLDIPVAITIKVDALGVTLQQATVTLDVIK